MQNNTGFVNNGTLSGGWTVSAGQTLDGEAGGFKYLGGAGTVLTNQGPIAWDTTKPLHLQSGASLVNRRLIDFSADGSFVCNGGAAVSVVNEGLIVKSAGSGAATISDGLRFANLGTIDVQSGALRLPGNFSIAGTLTGTGTFAQLAAGGFDVDLNAPGATDLLPISGGALPGGTLALRCSGACSLAVGDEFVILDAVGGLAGRFLGGITKIGFASGDFETVYDVLNDRVLLRVTETVTAVPEPQTGMLLAPGLAAVTFVARRRRARPA